MFAFIKSITRVNGQQRNRFQNVKVAGAIACSVGPSRNDKNHLQAKGKQETPWKLLLFCSRILEMCNISACLHGLTGKKKYHIIQTGLGFQMKGIKNDYN